jgi:hypothetical protein
VTDLPNIDNLPPEANQLILIEAPQQPSSPKRPSGNTREQEGWFASWWAAYWLHKAKKAARQAFEKQVRTVETFKRVMAATEAQSPEMLGREPQHRPHGATWLYQERWEDEPAQAANRPAAGVGSMANAIDQAMQILNSKGEDR